MLSLIKGEIVTDTFIKSQVLTLAGLSLVAEAKAVLSLIKVVKSRGKLSRAVWNM